MGRVDLLGVESLLHLKKCVFPESRGGRTIPSHAVSVAACSFNTTVITDITGEKEKKKQPKTKLYVFKVARKLHFSSAAKVKVSFFSKTASTAAVKCSHGAQPDVRHSEFYRRLHNL